MGTLRVVRAVVGIMILSLAVELLTRKDVRAAAFHKSQKLRMA